MSEHRRRWSSLPGWVQLPMLLATVVAHWTVAFGMVIYQVGGVWMFLPPMGVLGIFALVARPFRRLPAGFVATDWGRTLGHAWVANSRKVYFVPGSLMRQVSAETASAPFEDAVDGFLLHLHRRPDGLPSLLHVVLWTVGTPLLALLVLLQLGPLLEPGRPPVQWLILSLVALPVASIGFFVSLLPWLMAMAMARRVMRAPCSGVVSLKGRVLRIQGAQFTLGAVRQSAVLSPGKLVLENDTERLVIRGCTGELRALLERIEPLFGDEPTEGDPEAVAALGRLSRHSSTSAASSG